MPPLRERPEDIALLGPAFPASATPIASRQASAIRPGRALRALSSYEFPGNVRELENLIERAVTLALGDEVTADDLRPRVLSDQALASEGVALEIPDEGLDLDATLASIERRLLLQALERSGGVQKGAARACSRPPFAACGTASPNMGSRATERPFGVTLLVTAGKRPGRRSSLGRR